YGRSLRTHEKSWHITELELLSLLIGIEKYKHLILGKHLIVRTDSKMVQFLKSIKTKPSQRHSRWLVELSPILDSDLTTIEFISGKNNVTADILSRQEYGEPEISEAEKELIDSELIVLLTDFFDDKKAFDTANFAAENIFSLDLDRTIADRLHAEDRQTASQTDYDQVQHTPKWLVDQLPQEREMESMCLYLQYEANVNGLPTESNWRLGKQNVGCELHDHVNLNSKQKFEKVSATDDWNSFSNTNNFDFDWTVDDNDNNTCNSYLNMLFNNKRNSETLLTVSTSLNTNNSAFQENIDERTTVDSQSTVSAEQLNSDLFTRQTLAQAAANSLQQQASVDCSVTNEDAYNRIEHSACNRIAPQPTHAAMNENKNLTTVLSDQNTEDLSAGHSNAQGITDSYLQFVQITDDTLIELQNKCEELSPIIQYLTIGALPTTRRDCRRVLIDSESHFINDVGILCHFSVNQTRRKTGSENGLVQKVVPVKLRSQIIADSHRLTHSGISRCLAQISSLFYWKGMLLQIRKYIAKCAECTKGKRTRTHPNVPLQPLELAHFPGEILQIDVLGSIPATEQNKYTHIFTAIDEFTNYCWLVPLRGVTGSDISNALLKVFSSSGVPNILRSDAASSLVGKAFNDLMDILNIKHTVSSPRIHRSLGKCERLNRSLNDQLRTHLTADSLKNWDLLLPMLELINRSSKTANKPLSPFFLMHGCEMRTVFDCLYDTVRDGPEFQSSSEYVLDLQKRLKIIHRIHLENMGLDKQEMKQIFDRTSRPHTFKVNSLVWLKDEGQLGPRRLQLLWKGPYKIERFLTNYYTVLLKDLTTGTRVKSKVHVQRLKLYLPQLTEIQQRNFEKEFVPCSDDVIAEPAVLYTELKEQSVQTEMVDEGHQGTVTARAAVIPSSVVLAQSGGKSLPPNSATVQHGGYNLRKRS
ncbi:MAG: DDE-type integrase/transposase/recombinase, partial [Nitrososphaeraceae archaeon]|nr:DDE-type integrase/transposase/recombinase [Nitrososphaeraceae archaeon]